MSSAGSSARRAESNDTKSTDVGASVTDVQRVLVVGECLVDLAPAAPALEQRAGGDDPRPSSADASRIGAMSPVPAGNHQPRHHLVALPGGGPANIAVGLARLEVPCDFAGRFSRGGFGPWLRQNMADNGLDLRFSVNADEAATIALVTLDGQGRASYTFYGPTTADWQWAADELPDLKDQGTTGRAVKAVHTGSLALALEPGASVIAAWLTDLRRHSRVLISFDPNVRPGFVGELSAYRERLTTVIGSAHIVKASTDDLEAVYPGTAPRSVAEEWLSLGVPLVVITEGPDGATAYHRSGASTHRTPPPINLADTIGAGDAFTSAFLAYFSRHRLLSPEAISELTEAELSSSLGEGVTASAFTCSRLGADPPSRVELARFLGQQA